MSIGQPPIPDPCELHRPQMGVQLIKKNSPEMERTIREGRLREKRVGGVAAELH